jgi:4-hydroxy-3-polyprenylbenzoate decarboxylase
VRYAQVVDRLIVAITGATGTIYGVRLLQMLQRTSVETHLVMSRWGARTLVHETPYSPTDVHRLATHVHAIADQGAPISSGSFITRGMIIAPCSMRTVAAIATGYGDNLIHRAADVIIKERRKLVLVVRESPLSAIHLENMLKLARLGVLICPAMPAFYQHPQSVDEIVDQTVVRVLDQVDVHVDAPRWTGELEVQRSKFKVQS